MANSLKIKHGITLQLDHLPVSLELHLDSVLGCRVNKDTGRTKDTITLM